MAEYSTALPRRHQTWKAFYQELEKENLIGRGFDDVFVFNPLGSFDGPVKRLYSINFIKEQVIKEYVKGSNQFTSEELSQLKSCMYSSQYVYKPEYEALFLKVERLCQMTYLAEQPGR